MNSLSLATESVTAPGVGKSTFAGPTGKVRPDSQSDSLRVGWRPQDSRGLVSTVLIAREHVRRKLFGGSTSSEGSSNEGVANVGGSEESDSIDRLDYYTGLSRQMECLGWEA
jgi:hypothetical protein